MPSGSRTDRRAIIRRMRIGQDECPVYQLKRNFDLNVKLR